MYIEERAKKAGIKMNTQYVYVPADIIFKLTKDGLMVRKCGSDEWSKADNNTEFKVAGKTIAMKSLFKEEKISKIENWKFHKSKNNHYCIIGDIYDDDRTKDGNIVITSKIKWINFENNLVQTQNTLYKLGAMNKEE